MESEQDNFDNVMCQVGSSGRFQKWYNFIFNLVFVAFATMACFNVIIGLATPDHWCKVPGKELFNYTADQWKNLTIPRAGNGSDDFSQCLMYNITNEGRTQECTHGWEYDKTYYRETIVSQENWVCKENLRPTNLLVLAKIGEIAGIAISQLGDIYGRRPIMYLSIFALLIGRLGLLVSKGNYWLYVIVLIVGNLASLPLFQTPLIISVEMSSVKDRAMIPLFQCFGWTLGLCLAPLIFWVVGSWVPFLIITTVPASFILFTGKFMIESPRWLASVGKIKRSVKMLKRIGKINGTSVSDNVFSSLNKNSVTEEKSYGVMSLFTSWNLAKKTILIVIGWSCYNFIYLVLFFNVSNLKGNPFLNYFWQGLAEFPGYFVGKYLSDSIGRKYTKFISFMAMALVGVVLSYVLAVYPDNTVIISICGIAMKLVSSIDFYALNLQTLEIYPTCLRQTGSAVGFMASSLLGILAPYSTYLGTTVHASLPYVITTVLALIGAISGMFIPETLNEKLPETISEAEQFGTDQKIWSLPRRKIHTHKIVANDVI